MALLNMFSVAADMDIDENELNCHVRGDSVVFPSKKHNPSKVKSFDEAYVLSLKYFSQNGTPAKVITPNRPANLLRRLESPSDAIEFARLLSFCYENRHCIRSLMRVVALCDFNGDFVSSFSFAGEEIPGAPIDVIRSLFDQACSGATRWVSSDKNCRSDFQEKRRGQVVSMDRLKALHAGPKKSVIIPEDVPENPHDSPPAVVGCDRYPECWQSLPNIVRHQLDVNNCTIFSCQSSAKYTANILTNVQRLFYCRDHFHSGFFCMVQNVLDHLTNSFYSVQCSESCAVFKSPSNHSTVILRGTASLYDLFLACQCFIYNDDLTVLYSSGTADRHPTTVFQIPYGLINDPTGADRVFVNAMKYNRRARPNWTPPSDMLPIANVKGKTCLKDHWRKVSNDLSGHIITSYPGVSFFFGQFKGGPVMRVPITGNVSDYVPSYVVDEDPVFVEDPVAWYSGGRLMYNAMYGSQSYAYCKQTGAVLCEGVPDGTPSQIFIFPRKVVFAVGGSDPPIPNWRAIVRDVMAIRSLLWTNIVTCASILHPKDDTAGAFLATMIHYSIGRAYPIKAVPVFAAWKQRCKLDSTRLDDAPFKPSSLACVISSLVECPNVFPQVVAIMNSAERSLSKDKMHMYRAIGRMYDLVRGSNAVCREPVPPHVPDEIGIPHGDVSESQSPGCKFIVREWNGEVDVFYDAVLLRRLQIPLRSDRDNLVRWIRWAYANMYDGTCSSYY